MWKQGTIANVGKTEDGRFRLAFKRTDKEKALKEGKTAYFFLVLLKDYVGSPQVNDGFKDNNFIEGPKHNGHDCYYQEHEKPKMDSQTIYTTSDGKQEDVPSVVEDKDIPAFYLDSDLAAAMVVIRATEMCESVECELESFDEASSFLMTEIQKIRRVVK